MNNKLEVVLQDGKTITGTHVIGADGKWSKVREAFPSLAKQATMETVPSFGVHMNALAVHGFKIDGTYVISPPKECMFYIIVSPREVESEGFSISMVCYDETVDRYPWLKPPANARSYGWEDEYSAIPRGMESNKSLSEHLEAMFREELPAFYQVLDKKTFQTARVNRRVTWIRMTSSDGMDVSYATKDGRAALIGDAAHAMTPSMGEGCNNALESASRLVDSVHAVMERKGEQICNVESLNEGFAVYGLTRPKEVMPIQELSAGKNYLIKGDNETKVALSDKVSLKEGERVPAVVQ
jgi:2-polyprenyl-6-methoxyphenol hydroxylase-like FAD-dependent oxidoreductase